MSEVVLESLGDHIYAREVLQFMGKQTPITRNLLASCKDPPDLKLYCSLMFFFLGL